MSDSSQPHGLWNSPGQNTGVTAVPFSRGSSQPRSPTLHVNSLPAELPGKALQLTSYGITVIQMTGALRGTGGTLPTASSYEMVRTFCLMSLNYLHQLLL